MRISDWSSDVCSSDLNDDPDEGAVRSAVATLSESSAYWPTELLARGDAWVAQKDAEAGEREAEAARLAQIREQEEKEREEQARRDREASELAEREAAERSEEHTSELQSLMRISYAV